MEQWLNTAVYGLAPAAIAWAAARGRLFTAAWRGRIWGAAFVGLAALLVLPLLDLASLLPFAAWQPATRGIAAGTAGQAAAGATGALIRVPVFAAPSALLFASWALIAGWRAGALAVAVVRVRGARAAARPFPEWRSARLPGWTAANAGRFTLALSDRVEAPSMLGFGRPMVTVPTGLVERLSDEALDAVLLHELAHAERRDDLFDLAQQLLLSACWFHPAAWWIARRIAFEREAACDERAVRLTTTRRYARCLVTIAEAMQGTRMRRHALVASSAARGRQLRRRVEHLLALDARSRVARSSYLAVPVLAAIIAPVAAVPALPPVFDVVEFAQRELVATPLLALDAASTLATSNAQAGDPVGDSRPRAGASADRRMESSRLKSAATDTANRPAAAVGSAQESGPAAVAQRPAEAGPLEESLASRAWSAHAVTAPAAEDGGIVRDNVEGRTGTSAPFRAIGSAFSRAGADTGGWFSRAGASVASAFASK